MPDITPVYGKEKGDPMKITICSNHRYRSIVKNGFKLIFSLALILTWILTIPGGLRAAYAAPPLEDCDLDGFDDATGVPVPWPGYDETKGDTLAGPGTGSPVPAATPGDVNSARPTESNVTSDNAGSTASDNNNNTLSGNTDSKESGSAGSETSGKTNNGETGKTDSAASGDTNDAAPEKTGNAASGDKNNAASGKSNSAASGKASNITTENTDSAASGNSGSIALDSPSNATPGNTGSIASGQADGAKTGSASVAVTGTSDTQENVTQGENIPPEGSSDLAVTANTDPFAEDVEAIINTKGSIEITEASGSIIHAGSSLIISGVGFAGNVNHLELVIQSEARQLGSVTSAENGSFETQISIPGDLEAGSHNVVVLYQGNEIARRQIEVGPKAADSFLQALSVGFTKENKGLLPGLLILAGLFVSGAGALVIGAFSASAKRKNAVK